MASPARTLAVLASVTAISCTELGTPIVAPEVEPVFEINDGAHGQETVPGFLFLPPTVKVRAEPGGTFDATLEPVVEICGLGAPAPTSPDDCTVFKRLPADGPPETMRVDPTQEDYSVLWQTTDAAPIVVGNAYRAFVHVNGRVLGFVDLMAIAKKRDDRDVPPGYTGVVVGGPFLFKFRIETGIPGAVVLSPRAANIPDDRSQEYAALVTDLHGAPLAGATVQWGADDPVIDLAPPNGVTNASGETSTTATPTGVVSSDTDVTVIGESQGAIGVAILTVQPSGMAPSAADDAYGPTGVVPVVVDAASGLLANDDLGVPDARVTRFGGGSLGGDVTDYAADGAPVDLGGGGTLSVADDGSLSLTPAEGFVGLFTFEYELENGVASSTAIVTLSISPLGTTKTWVGSADPDPQDWSNPDNWASPGVPTSADYAFVPAAAAHQPVLSNGSSIGTLYLEDGARLELAGFELTVSGDLRSGHTLTGLGRVVITGSPSTLSGDISRANISATGTVVIAGPTRVGGHLNVAEGGQLDVGAHTLTVDGDFSTDDGGTLKMTDASSVLTVHGNVDFGGGSTDGLLTDGEIRAFGNSFTARGGGPSFASSGNHSVRFERDGSDGGGGGGVPSQAVRLEASSPTGSRLNHVTVPAQARVSLDGHIWVLGQLTVAGWMAGLGEVHVTTAVPHTDFAYAVPRTWIEGAMTATRDARFETLIVSTNGRLGVGAHTLTVDGDFFTEDDGTLTMTDASGVLDIQGNADFRGGSTEGLLTAGEIRASGDRFEAPGEPGAFAPSGDHAVVFDRDATGGGGGGGGGLDQSVRLNSNGPNGNRFHHLTVPVAARTVLDADTWVTGQLTVAGAMSGLGDMHVTSALPRTGGEYTVPTTWIEGAMSAGADAQFEGLVVPENGQLDVGSHLLTVNRDFRTEGDGTLTMTHPAGMLHVEGNIAFGGGSTDGLLTAGVIRASGTDFSAFGPEPVFSPSGSHTVVFDRDGSGGGGGEGATPTSISLDNSHATRNHFHHVSAPGSAGPRLSFSQDVVITGRLVAENAHLWGLGRRLEAWGIDLDAVTVDGVLLVIDGADPDMDIDNTSFTGFDITDTQLTVRHPGAGAAFTFQFGGNSFMGLVERTGNYLELEDTDPMAPTLFLDIGVDPGAGGSGFLSGDEATLLLGASGPIVDWLPF